MRFSRDDYIVLKETNPKRVVYKTMITKCVCPVGVGYVRTARCVSLSHRSAYSGPLQISSAQFQQMKKDVMYKRKMGQKQDTAELTFINTTHTYL